MAEPDKRELTDADNDFLDVIFNEGFDEKYSGRKELHSLYDKVEGALRTAIMTRIDQIRAECRREAIEECAQIALVVKNEAGDDAPCVVSGSWRLACAEIIQRIRALADRPAPGVPPERNETPLHAPSIHRVQDNTYVREPSEAEVEAAWKVWIGSVSITPKEARARCGGKGEGRTMTEAADAKPEPGWYMSNDRDRWLRLRSHFGSWTDDDKAFVLCALDDLLRAVAGPIGVGWELIDTAPKDGEPTWVYVAMAHGLPPFEDKVAWHPDAGWCADELRPVTHWHPETTKMLRDAAQHALVERERIADRLAAEADNCPCAEDASVLRETAMLVRADFSYALIDAKPELARESKPEGRG